MPPKSVTIPSATVAFDDFQHSPLNFKGEQLHVATSQVPWVSVLRSEIKAQHRNIYQCLWVNIQFHQFPEQKIHAVPIHDAKKLPRTVSVLPKAICVKVKLPVTTQTRLFWHFSGNLLSWRMECETEPEFTPDMPSLSWNFLLLSTISRKKTLFYLTTIFISLKAASCAVFATRCLGRPQNS